MKHKKTTKLALKPYKNLSGTVSWRITGWFLGERYRKNFKDKQEALAEKSTLEIQAAQNDAGMRASATFLADAQLREAEALYLRIKEKPRSMSFYLDYALTHYQEPISHKPLAEATVEYLAQRTADHARGLISDAQLSTIRKHMTKIDDCYPKVQISDLDAEKITAYCARDGATLKTHNNRRGIISSLLKFAMLKKWISKNPIGDVPHYRIAHKRGTAPTLSAEKAAALMDFVEQYRDGCLVPYFALTLFAGIRPDYEDGEISKLTKDAINLATGVIHIEPEVSKVDMKRRITIQPNLAEWLKAYPLDKYPLFVTNFKHRRSYIAKKFSLSHDVLRHTFVSMHIAKYRSMGDTALQAGNSEEIIRKHYLDVKSPAEAESFFNIMPKNATEGATTPSTPANATETQPDETRQLAA